MKKLSFGWKIFLVFSYVQLVVAGGLLLLFLVRLITFTDRSFRGDDLWYLILAGIMLLVPLLNSTNIVYVMHRYFPGQLVPRNHRVFMNVVGIFTTIEWLALIILYSITFTEELRSLEEYPGYYKDKTGLYLLGFFVADWVIGLYILIYQVKLASKIKRTSNQKMQDLIESIGKEEESGRLF